MKNLIIIFATLFLTNSAIARDVPSCWDNPDVVEGSYIISIDTDTLTKEELLRVMDQARAKHLRPNGYPLLFGNTMFITTQAVDYGVGEHRLPKDELRRRVEKALQPIADTPGVRISCNGIVRPFGGEGNSKKSAY